MADMLGKIELLMQELEDAQTELEELEECGDLEDRLDAMFRISNLEELLFRARLEETS